MSVPPSRRSGPVHSEETTAAIRDAVVAELAERGYDQLSFESIARRAGVGKAAIYRRWDSRQQMVLDVVAHYAADTTAAQMWPDTGSLEGDVTALVTTIARYLTDTVIARITADLFAVLARDDAFAAALHERVGAFRREQAVAVVKRAVRRGELPRTVDAELAADLMAAPVYWRLVVARGVKGATGPAYRRRVVAAVLAAIRATA